jgi:transposase
MDVFPERKRDICFSFVADCVSSQLCFFKRTPKVVGDLGFAKGRKRPWAFTVRICCLIPQVVAVLRTFLDQPDVEPTNHAAERTLRPAVIHSTLRIGVQVQAQRVRSDTVDVLTVTTALKRQGRDMMGFLKKAREAQKCFARTEPLQQRN